MSDPNPKDDADDRQKQLIEKMRATKEKWDAEAEHSEDGPDETDALLSKAIEMALDQGKGWKEGEREAYLAQLDDDDYLPPLFATNQEDLEKSGMAEAFSSLMHDDPPVRISLESKKKGNDAFMRGKQNVAKNDQVNIYLFLYNNQSSPLLSFLIFSCVHISTIEMQSIIITKQSIGLKKSSPINNRMIVKDSF
jgi:hypothetical protein